MGLKIESIVVLGLFQIFICMQLNEGALGTDDTPTLCGNWGHFLVVASGPGGRGSHAESLKNKRGNSLGDLRHQVNLG